MVVTTRQPVTLSSSNATLPESLYPSVMTVAWFPTPRELTAPGRLHAQPLSQGLHEQRSISFLVVLQHPSYHDHMRLPTVGLMPPDPHL